MKNRLRSLRAYFWAGLAARIAAAPFILQWFHPDERQMLEFAHFHAHGRLQPFMESRMHLRNQTLPWVLSQLIHICDWLHFDTPWSYLTSIHLFIGIASWLAIYACLESFRKPSWETSDRRQSMVDRAGWFFALFWAFPFFYSRQLIEAVSLPSTLLLLRAIRRRRAAEAGAWAGLTAILRYPSFLFGIGGFLLLTWKERGFLTGRDRSSWIASLALKFCLAALGAIAIGGIADALTYGHFLESAWNYFAFNRPNGPVEAMFGRDGLDVYWRWFEQLFVGPAAAVFLALGAVSLLRSRDLLIFSAPYLIGHLASAHREPRFMLPMLPLLAFAILQARVEGKLDFLAAKWRKLPASLQSLFLGLLAFHIAANFAWYPLTAWAQWRSSLGTLIRHSREISREPTALLGFGDPIIDAILPISVPWSDPACQWHRPFDGDRSFRLWLLRPEPAPGCRLAIEERLPEVKGEFLQRILRPRTASLWECRWDTTVSSLCPGGLKPAPPGEPLIAPDLRAPNLRQAAP